MTIKVEQNNRVCVATDENGEGFTLRLLPETSKLNDLSKIAFQLSENLAAHMSQKPMPHKVDVVCKSANWGRDEETGDMIIRFSRTGLPFGMRISCNDGGELPLTHGILLCESVTVKAEPKPAPRPDAGRKRRSGLRL